MMRKILIRTSQLRTPFVPFPTSRVQQRQNHFGHTVIAQTAFNGTVSDDQGTIAGAVITVVGTSNQTLTNAEGQFTITANLGDNI